MAKADPLRQAILKALDARPTASLRDIAQEVGASHTYVAMVRRQLQTSPERQALLEALDMLQTTHQALRIRYERTGVEALQGAALIVHAAARQVRAAKESTP